MTLEETLRAKVAEWRERYRTATPLSIASVAVHTCADELEAILDAHETAEKSGDIRYAPADAIDEVVMRDANVHLEMLDDRCAMLIVDNGVDHIHLQVFAGHGKLTVQLYERFDPREHSDQPQSVSILEMVFNRA